MPPFRRVAIVGVGLIGGSIGLAVRRHVRGARVVGVDRKAVLRAARARCAIDEATTSLARGLQGADLVILALPVDAILEILPRVAVLLPQGAVVTDVGSTKEAIDRAARRAGLGARFVGGHPMAGSERSGIAHADGRLFAGAPWVLCRPEGAAASRRVAARQGGSDSTRRVAALVRRPPGISRSARTRQCDGAAQPSATAGERGAHQRGGGPRGQALPPSLGAGVAADEPAR